MATAKTVTARKSKFERKCDKCSQPIVPGQQVHNWSFRYGGDHYQHVACGPVRASQLTQSKMSAVYAAQEAAHDALNTFDSSAYLDANCDGSGGDLDADLTSVVADVAEAVREVEQEYRDAAEAMGDAGGENEERADELDGWASGLEEFSIDADPPEKGDHPTAEDFEGAVAEWLEDAVQQARDLIDECPL